MSLRLGTKIVAGNAVVVPENIYLKTTYDGGTSGYRIWSDGYCEQWGRWDVNNVQDATTTITLTKTYKNVDYNITFGVYMTAHSGTCGNVYSLPTANSFNLHVYGYFTKYVYWRTFGYLASGQY